MFTICLVSKHWILVHVCFACMFMHLHVYASHTYAYTHTLLPSLQL